MMSEKKQTTKSLNIQTLLSEDKYLIPLYQRNYAWGRDEIQQLLNDIMQTEGNYYLGTLVVYKRGSGLASEMFEIIDGQQRHTTLSIINAVLKNKLNSLAIEKRNLYFEGREKSENIIDELLRDNSSFVRIKEHPTKDKSIMNILDAVNVVEEFIKLESEKKIDESIKGVKKFELVEFANRFYTEVIIFRAELPVGTNLNHYFEIMNNRGEQLEMHEILKAAFMKKIANNKMQKFFAIVWDACSVMNSHVIMNFKTNNYDNYKGDRKELFGDNYEEIPTKESICELLNRMIVSDVEEAVSSKLGYNPDSILGILRDHSLPDRFNQNKKDDITEKFTSVIDFPNFLLQVYKLEKKDVKLDDKFLLEDFGYPNNLPDSIDFIVNLLKCRVLFDRYVIKREGDVSDWSWSIKKVVETENSKFDYRVTFEETELRKKTRMIQAMFQVSFASNSYKNWLFYFLRYLVCNQGVIESMYLTQLESQANEQAIDDLPLSVDLSFNNTKRYLFNYLDYLLWIEYYEMIIRPIKLDEDESKTYLNIIDNTKDLKSKFEKFKFVQRSSVEHLFPQSKVNDIIAENDEEKFKVLNLFGNLCLISSSSNSAYNDDFPFQKKLNSKDKNESLKQLIMFASFEGNNWNKPQIEIHHKEMIDLINKYAIKTKKLFKK
jgi:hypothetical protein